MAQTPQSTPWWSNLLAVLITAIVSVLGTLYALRPRVPGAPITSSIGSFFKDTITYIPHILILFGVLADMLTYEGVYSIPSLIGLLSIVANWVMKYFWAGMEEFVGKAIEVLKWKLGKGPSPDVPNPRIGIPGRNIIGPPTGGGLGEFFRDYDGCTVQGFGWAKSKYAPQTLVITATIFSYYMFDLIQNRGWTSAAATITMFLMFYVAQVVIIGDCDADPTEPGVLAKAVAAFTEGLLFGGSSYAIVQAYAPERLPTSAISPYPRRTAADLTPGPNGTMVDEDGYPYLCLPNGQCIPDLSSAEARKNFASLISSTIGSGGLPDMSDCPAAPSDTVKTTTDK
jgi:hypothetical protein